MDNIIINNNTHNPGYQVRRTFGDERLDKVKEILGEVIRKHKPDYKAWVRTSTLHEDTKQSKDLILRLQKGDKTVELGVGVRSRKDTFILRDFTIRKDYFGSKNSERKKIKNASIYMYTWDNQDGTTDWIVVDLKKLERSGLIEKYANTQHTGNKDDGNHFFGIDVGVLKYNGCLIDYSTSLEPHMNKFDPAEEDDFFNNWDF